MQIGTETILILLAGTALCFAGWHLFRVSKYIIGFVIGGNIGYSLAQSLVVMLDKPELMSWAPWISVAGVALFGILGVFMVKAVVKLLLFVGGFMFGAGVVSVLTGGVQRVLQMHSFSLLIQDLSIWAIAVGAACGILFIFFEKGFVILYTAALGAYFATWPFGLNPIGFLVLTAAGALVQFRVSRGIRVSNLTIEKRHS